jgi:hypothetical protein
VKRSGQSQTLCWRILVTDSKGLRSFLAITCARCGKRREYELKPGAEESGLLEQGYEEEWARLYRAQVAPLNWQDLAYDIVDVDCLSDEELGEFTRQRKLAAEVEREVPF